MEAAPCPRRSPRRSNTVRSRQAAAQSATSPYGHALADLACPALGLSRAWPDRVADDLGYRAISGHAYAPPISAGRGCGGAGHRRRVPSSFGRARCHLLALFSIIERRDVYRFVAGCTGALAFCFGPPLSTYLGRTSLLGGLVFTSAATSHPGHLKAASPGGSSLWAVFDLSPGPFWLVAALSMSVALVIVLAHKARSTNSHHRAQTAGSIDGWWSSPVRDSLRSGSAPTVLRPRPRWTVHRRALVLI